MPYQARIDTPQSLGIALQQARMASGMTQRDLAQQLGTTQKYIWELEQGKESVAVTRLFEALRATGATVTVTIPEGDDGRG
ncbi:helix-turn-helix domain-containing protein [Agromyces aureus]|uniref:XRE family transcriptional regulator n=1 Tax=Agromyces aureus TaxID=453304 RepID=A0A191WBA4_9MICO|nr:helix-turn-helix transcriptional regulator [Agromyces aureus]ANJ25478.1 XRE family transcriptional regulator [Agromyces aureus]